VPHTDLSPDEAARLGRLEARRTAAQGRKRSAEAAGDREARGRAHGEMVRASEELGESATDMAARRHLDNPQRMRSELPGEQKTGEFDRIYRDGDNVYIYESKGAGAQRGSRRTRKGLRAEQGTPQYRDDIIDNMERQVRRHLRDPRYGTDPGFTAQIDELNETVEALTAARRAGRLHYAQVSQRVDSQGRLRPEIDVTPFDPNRSIAVATD
jgi:protein-tyrosine-phosphatase